MTETERLAKIAELLPGPCRAPDVANGYDTCSHGEAWPCNLTRAKWLAAGVDPDAEIRKVLDAAKAEMEAEQAEWEALNETDPAAARRYALRKMGW